jgi:hypothetical protein
MRAIKIMAIGAIGFLLGLGLWYFSYSGASQSWEKLPAAPQAVSALIPAEQPFLFIKTSDGSIYSYSGQQNEGWLKDTAPENLGFPYEVTQPCDFSSPEFSLLAKPPKNIKDCFQEKNNAADGYIQDAYVLDRDGSVWEWSYIYSSFSDLPRCVCIPSTGFLLGLLIAFYAIPGKGNRPKSSPPTPDVADTLHGNS